MLRDKKCFSRPWAAVHSRGEGLQLRTAELRSAGTEVSDWPGSENRSPCCSVGRDQGQTLRLNIKSQLANQPTLIHNSPISLCAAAGNQLHACCHSNSRHFAGGEVKRRKKCDALQMERAFVDGFRFEMIRRRWISVCFQTLKHVTIAAWLATYENET